MLQLMNTQFSNEQQKLLHDIGILDFVVVELTEFLDTHPNDRNALEYFNHYNRMSDQAKKEYAKKFGPLTIALASESDCNNWDWATLPMPWEGGCA